MIAELARSLAERPRPVALFGAPEGFDHPQVVQRRFGVAPPAQDHEIVGIGDEASAEASLKAELLPPQHESAQVEVRQSW